TRLQAPSPSGKAADCKSAIPGSNPGGASSLTESFPSRPFSTSCRKCGCGGDSADFGADPVPVPWDARCIGCGDEAEVSEASRRNERRWEDDMDTMKVTDWLARWRAGDQQALEELLRAAYPQLENLARKMLKGFPRVRRLNDTNDVLQNTVLRLVRSLR